MIKHMKINFKKNGLISRVRIKKEPNNYFHVATLYCKFMDVVKANSMSLLTLVVNNYISYVHGCIHKENVFVYINTSSTIRINHVQDQFGKEALTHHVHISLGWMYVCAWYRVDTFLSQSYCMVSFFFQG